jgi:DNA repair exonuclease SbcCD ATPase subunit
MAQDEKRIDAFDAIFEAKLTKIKHRLQEHLKEKDHKKRDKQTIKNLIKEAKELRKILRSKKKQCCPHCGGEL